MATLENTDFNTTINKLIAYPQKDGYSTMVFMILWKIKASYTDPSSGIEYYSEADFSTDVNTETIENFVPFDQLTKEKVMSWIEKTDNVGEIKQNLLISINDQINPNTTPTLLILEPPF